VTLRTVSTLSLIWTSLFLAAHGPAAERTGTLRPPAVPLVTCDPYFSIWSCADRLHGDTTRHWTRTKQSLVSLIRVDGAAFRLMGDEPKDVGPLPQMGVDVLPTRTIYRFRGPQVQVTLTFLTPVLPDDLDVLSRPLTYLTWSVRSVDGREHAVSLYFSAGADIAVNVPTQPVVWSHESIGGLTALRIGSAEQPVLQKKGDDLRIDWGYLYVASDAPGHTAALAAQKTCADRFVAAGTLPSKDDERMPRAVNDDSPAAAVAFNLGRVADRPASRTLMLAYDDLYSINYFGKKLRPYWRRRGSEARDLLQAASREFPSLLARSTAFDEAFLRDLEKCGGREYARLCALAYRQCHAANKLAADTNGQPLLFPKENFSNGCIGTVDVIYPMAPQFLLFSPALAKASVITVLNYAASSRWKFPFAPHDLGTYPLATGQVYGGGERTEDDQMPVEESGNMLLLVAAIAKMDGNADFAAPFWPQLTRWAQYLEAKGFDPEKQLCTDDFAGHLAHNVNLSAKAIEALGAYGMLCTMRGDPAGGDKYHDLAVSLARKWVDAANDGDHFRLAFDRPGTWSQKYNLVWDRILDLRLFPTDVCRKEMAFYLQHIDRYGLPLDNRKPYAKLDWSLWTATLADSPADFQKLVRPVYQFLNDSPSRVPMTDLYWTNEGTQVGMQARSVVGGVFIKALADPALWKKWADRGAKAAGPWAALPKPPLIKEIVPTARREPVAWRYTLQRPQADWYDTKFDAGQWQEGTAGFGTTGTPGSVVRTEWKTGDIWIRREFTLPEVSFHDLQFLVHHDEDVEIYINGVRAATASGYTTDYQLLPLSAAAQAALKPGKNVLAAHCHQTTGGQYIDVGLVDVLEQNGETTRR
jgi:Domain of unknown function (DUF4965)/Domain of unknown function (DUF5127)/Domain of unknown function (DUF1793)/Domain of unknown function (DUF4964)